MIRHSTKLTAIAAIALLGGATALNCSKGNSPSSGQGDVKLAFSLPDGLTINQVAYTVTLVQQHHAAGPPTINTSDKNANVSLDFALPASTGDTIKLAATTTSGVSCTGVSNPFDLISGQTTTVLHEPELWRRHHVDAARPGGRQRDGRRGRQLPQHHLGQRRSGADLGRRHDRGGRDGRRSGRDGHGRLRLGPRGQLRQPGGSDDDVHLHGGRRSDDDHADHLGQPLADALLDPEFHHAGQLHRFFWRGLRQRRGRGRWNSAIRRTARPAARPARPSRARAVRPARAAARLVRPVRAAALPVRPARAAALPVRPARAAALLVRPARAAALLVRPARAAALLVRPARAARAPVARPARAARPAPAARAASASRTPRPASTASSTAPRRGTASTTSKTNLGTTVADFGCDGFTGADKTNCLALEDCLSGSACQAAIASATSDYGESQGRQRFAAALPLRQRVAGHLPRVLDLDGRLRAAVRRVGGGRQRAVALQLDRLARGRGGQPDELQHRPALHQRHHGLQRRSPLSS